MNSDASTAASGGTRFPCFDRPWTERCPCGDDPSLGEGCPLSKPKDREPQPGDGPDYHADHAAWEQRQGQPLAP